MSGLGESHCQGMYPLSPEHYDDQQPGIIDHLLKWNLENVCHDQPDQSLVTHL